MEDLRHQVVHREHSQIPGFQYPERNRRRLQDLDDGRGEPLRKRRLE